MDRVGKGCYNGTISRGKPIFSHVQPIFSYFAGDRTLDDTIALLQNRVGLYLNEQK
jgi:hypothetical protein